MVVGDCLCLDKNDTGLGGSIFLNKLVARKFLPGKKCYILAE